VIWRGVTGGTSVHLTDWPAAGEVPADRELVEAMDEVRTVCSTVLSLRKAQNLRVRLPLSEVTIAAGDAERLAPYVDIIADEVNVKKVDLTADVDVHGKFELVVNARAAGPRLGKQVQDVIKAVKAGDWTETDGVVTVHPGRSAGSAPAAGITLLPEEYTQRLVAAEPESTAALPGNAGLVVLNSTVTEELEAEGWARDVIRELQEARKNANLDVSDRISLVLGVDEAHLGWAQTHSELIAGEVLATEFSLADPGADAVDVIDGVRARITRR
jgi:isoleucyl-tRNA synthetase